MEVASALSKKMRYADLPRSAVDSALSALPEIVTELVADAGLLPLALDLSISLRHALQDCVYLALAIQRDCVLITADVKFSNAVATSSHAGRLILLEAQFE